MEPFWNIMAKWDEFGQGLFLLLLAGGFFGMVFFVFYYLAVMIRGWPPYDFKEGQPED